MVRQERTAAMVTSPAGQTPPPARPRSWLLGPSVSPLTGGLCQQVGRLPKGRANWQQLVKINGRHLPLLAGDRTRLTDPLI